MKKIIKHTCAFSLLTVSLIAANQTLASGIRVGLESTSDLGNQFAGGAALAGDASTNYYNAAGLTRIHNDQFVASFIGVASYNQFSGTTFASSTTTPLLGAFGANFNGSGSIGSRDVNVLPSFHYSMPVYNRTYLGVSVTTPYGLSDDYGSTSLLRYSTVRASAYSTNLGPSLAYQVTDGLSVAAGPDLMRFHFDAQNAVRTQLATAGDSYQDNNAYGWGWGGHAGMLYQFNDCSRVGLSYRSQVVQHLNGISKFTGNGVLAALSTTSNNLQVNMTLPPMTMLSGYHAFTRKWAVLGTVDYTQWSAFHTISSTNIAAPGVLVNYVAMQNYKDTVHAAIAANYQMNDMYLFRAGFGVDQTASRTAFTSPTNPGLGFYAVNIGMRYSPNSKLSVDGAYSHAFLRSTSTAHVTTVGAAQTISETGRLRGYGDVLGIQFNWNL